MPRSPSKRGKAVTEKEGVVSEVIPKCRQNIAFVKNALLSSSDVMVIKLRHPSTGAPATYIVDKDNNNFYDLIAFDEGHRSWFLGETIESNGKLFIISPLDVTYLLLPYLMKSIKTVPLDHLLEDEEFPAVSHLEAAVMGKDLSHVADKKGSPDLCAWKYNEESTLAWLAGRVTQLASLLQKKKVPTSTAQSLTYVRTMELEETKEAYMILSHGIMSDYLSEDLSKSLYKHLKLPEVKKINTPGGSENQPPKKQKVQGPLEDYSKDNNAATKAKPVMTAKAKALAKSASGSKSITSFFAKK